METLSHPSSAAAGARSGAARRVGLVLALVLLAFVVPFAAPIGIARACGCGVYSPADGGDASVPHETALVRVTGSAGAWDEDIYLSLTLDSDVRTGALLFPVPDRTATVSAGPRTLFPALESASRVYSSVPRTGNGEGAGAPAPSVTVENRQAIGPLDVVTLSSGDPAALTAWLQQNGFTAKPALTQAARPYTSAGWAFVAVRLRPGAATSTSLDGRLDPLHIRVHAKQIVYPMRLSAMATAPEQVTVYTLSAHGLTLDTATRGMSQVFSGSLDPTAHPELATVTSGGTTYLTRLEGTLTPSDITDDFHFTPGATPTPEPSAAGDRSGGPSGGPDIFARSDQGQGRTTQTVVIVTAVVVLLALIGIGYLLHERRRARPPHS